ncbi:MAG TPA: ATP-binding cassette domain-containing protein [Kiloniellaceae bacterium]|nr:ATP-binding cassette domain-containing protein [Kiloniellaceae bacterium]
MRQAAPPRVEAAGSAGGIWPLTFDDVRFEVGGKALVDGLSLTLAAGARTVVMGPNGAGKSLFLRLLAGLLQPTAGRITYGGRAADAAALRRVAVVFQRPVMLRRSVAANLRHALATYGVPRAERARRIAELLALAGLQHLADRPARVLSGGEQQRLAMVRALGAEPELLLLDEATASLDPQATAAIEDLIGQAAAKGVKIVMVTHDRGQARRLADEVLFIHRGALAERCAADVFFNRPNSAAAQAYLEGRLLL